ncbi:GA4 desaturase [Fusarium sp. NRRL 52700]|nr:GA4 desaturase [Fusarium sp. NRRL 52700]
MLHQYTPLESPVGNDIATTTGYHSGPAVPTSPIAGVTTLEDRTQQVVAVTNIRSSVSSFTVDGNGFPLAKPSRSRKVYDPEIIELPKSITGAKKVMILLASSRNVPYEGPEFAPPYPMPLQSSSGPDVEMTSSALYHKSQRLPKCEEESSVRKPHKDWGPSGSWNTLQNWILELMDEAKDIIKASDEADKLPGGRAKNYRGGRWAILLNL